MLTSSVVAPEEALAAAMKYAALGLAAKGYEGEHTLSAVALRSYRTRGNTESDLDPSTWVPYALAFWVMRGADIVARVSVAHAAGGFRADAMEFVAGKKGFIEAIAIADRLADEPGEREMHMVEIPQFNALLIRVTGDKPRFVDRVRGKVYTEEGIVDELARRRRIVLGIEPNEDDTPGFRG